MAEVAFVGAGGLGGVIAAQLWAGGVRDLALCVRTPFDRLIVTTPAGVIEASPKIVTDPAQAGPAKWVFVAVKTYQTPSIAPWLDALCTPETRIVVLQNGVEHRERIAPLAPNVAGVIPCAIICPSEQDAPGRMTLRGPTRVTVPDDQHGRALADLAAGSNVEIILSDDFPTALWAKLCMNISSGPVSALVGRPIAGGAYPALVPLIEALIAECVAVGRAEGATFPDDAAHSMAASLAGATVGHRPSTLQDRLAGRPMEHEALNGAVARIGARHGIPTPMNAAVAALLEAIGRPAMS
jgi:2-dehydropantoate 2-reductase